MTGGNLLRLRLAARSLVEWRTPVSDPEFDSVLEYIAELHGNPNARLLASRKDILKCDEEGFFILYLIEHIGISAPTSAGERAVPMAQVHEIVADRFRRLATLHESGKTVCWKTERERTRLEHAILGGIADSNEQIAILGIEAMLAVVIPLDLDLQQNLANRVLANFRPSNVDRFKQRILQISWGHIAVVIWALYAIALVSTASIIGPNQLINIVFGYAFTAVIALSLIPLGITAVLYTLVDEIQYEMLKDSNPFAPMSEKRTFTALASLAGRKTGVISNLVMEEYEAYWFTLALERTKVVSRPVIREALRLLKMPGVREYRRAMIVEWLSKVEIAPDI